MRKLNTFFKITAVAAAAFMVSCEDTSLEDFLSDQDTQVSENYIKTEAALSNVYSIVDRSLRDSTFQASDSVVVDGALVIRDGNLVTIDFGNGVVGTDGNTRKGIISINETSSYLTSASLEVELKNFSVNDKAVEGSMELSQVLNSFELSIDSFSAGEMVELNANKEVTWVSGFMTFSDDSDDVFNLTGTATGTDLENNRMLSSNIAEVMKYDRSCQYKIVQGVIDFDLEGTDSTDAMEVSIDFLDTDGCNNLAKLKVKQGETEIELTKQFSGF